MKEKFFDYAERLINQDNPALVYEDLIKILRDNCLFHEEGACFEKLWHITQDANLYKKVGDVFLNKVGNPAIAREGYQRYIQYSDPQLYLSYMKAMKKSGVSNVDDELDPEDYTKEIIRICDAYDAIVYMTICLLKQKDYDGVIDLSQYLKKSEQKIKKYIDEHPQYNDNSYVSDNEACKKHLSALLSEVPHRNDINMLAIELDNTNNQAYINIMGDYITYGNYNDAVLFFNYTYCKAFNISEKNNVIDICWYISDYWRDKFDFYNAVMFQKFALEQELAEV